MDRLIERLRTERSVYDAELADEAADEIERLRAALERIANPRDGEGYGEDLREMAREALKDD